MCGIVGAVLTNVTQENIETIRRVLLETEIRGKHASGIAWYDGENVNSHKEASPISKFLETFDLNKIVYNNSIKMIGHIRYSTSDIHYNQPIGNEDAYIVHNGVITQIDSDKWYPKYGYKCSTKNDSELLFHAINTKEDYLMKFPGCSASYCYINSIGEFKHSRNSLRPQWKALLPNGFIIASTKNILIRAGLDNIEMVKTDDNKEMIKRNMDESYNRVQTIL